MQAYSLLLGLGTFAGLLLVIWRAPQKEVLGTLNAGIWVLFGALVGSRAAFVLVNFGYYQSHFGEIFQVWKGGLSGIGALVGGAVAVFLVAKVVKIHPGALADGLLPLAGTLAVTAWLGGWVSSFAYGLPSDAWWALPARDEWGVVANRVPVQLLGAALTLLLLWLLDWQGRRFGVPGMSALAGLFLISAEILALSFLRADPAPAWSGLRLEAWGALGLLIISALGAVVLLVRGKSKGYQGVRQNR